MISYVTRLALIIFAVLLGGIGLVAALDFSSANVLIFGQPNTADNTVQLMAMDTPRGISYPFLPYQINGVQVDIAPDGRHVAFIESDTALQISVWDIDTRQLRQYPFPEGRPVSFNWSPNSEKITYAILEPSILGILDLSTGEHQLLDSNDQYSFIFPQWSPDGNNIFYFQYTGRNRSTEICLFELRTFSESCVEAGGASFTWSTDGEYIIFLSREDQSQLYSPYQMNVLTGDFAPLALPDEEVLPVEDQWEILDQINRTNEGIVSVIWSPDNERLAYVGSDYATNVNTLRVYDLDQDSTVLPLVTMELQRARYFQPIWWPPLQ